MKCEVEVPPQQTHKFLITLQQYGGTVINYRPYNDQLLFLVSINQPFELHFCVWQWTMRRYDKR